MTLGKENKLKLGVSWLHRSIEVKLGKGESLKAAPNEIFYSFRKDEIDAELILHPCKVSFLPKGVELPSGVSSFVCRRVYDTADKCLRWLSDQDHINVSLWCLMLHSGMIFLWCLIFSPLFSPGLPRSTSVIT